MAAKRPWAAWAIRLLCVGLLLWRPATHAEMQGLAASPAVLLQPLPPWRALQLGLRPALGDHLRAAGASHGSNKCQKAGTPACGARGEKGVLCRCEVYKKKICKFLQYLSS